MQHQTGKFCWNDLATTDLQAASKFYEGLLHWQSAESKTADGRPYRVEKASGKDVGGIYALRPEHKMPQWMPYVAVEDADRIASKAQTLGAKILKEPFDLGKDGRMALIQDPVGALFGLWQPKNYPGAQASESPGTAVWNELLTLSPEVAIPFYTQLFGWSTEKQLFGSQEYVSFKMGDQHVGGLIKPAQKWGQVPAHWMTYFQVEDCYFSTNLAKKLGATILAEPIAMAGVGIFSVIKDPQGAAIGLIKPQPAEERAA